MATIKGVKKLKQDNTNDFLRLSGSNTELVSTTSSLLFTTSTGTFSFVSNVLSGPSASDFYVRAQTADGSDNKTLIVASGWDGTGSNYDRGAILRLYGNEHTNVGGWELLAGNPGTADGTLSSSRYLNFNTASGLRLRIDSVGNLYYTGSSFVISADTSDGADSKQIALQGGGSGSNTRGAYITLAGNEHSNTGLIQIISGDVSGSGITINSSHSSGTIRFLTGGADRWRVDSGNGAFRYTGGSDMRIIGDDSSSRACLIAADSNAVNAAYLQLLTDTTQGGHATLETGIASAAQAILSARGTSGTIRLRTGGSERWQVDASGYLLGNVSSNVIATNSVDGSDSKSLQLQGGGAELSTPENRGAFIRLFGNEHGSNPGRVDIQSTGSGNLFLLARGGTLDFGTGTTTKWQINSSGQFVQDGTNGDAIIFNKTTGLIKQGTSDGSDTGRIFLAAGGDAIESRGAHLLLYGNEASNPGTALLNSGGGADAILQASSSGTAKARLSAPATSGSISFETQSVSRWTISNTGHLSPVVDVSYDIGTASLRVRNLYVDNIIGGPGGGSFSTLSNNTFIFARNAGDTADIGFIKVNSSNHTVVNAATGQQLIMSINDNKVANFDTDGLRIRGPHTDTFNQSFVLKTFGYSSGYKALFIGSTNSTPSVDASSIWFNVDLSANTSGSFGGDGSEYFFRNGASIGTPNATNDGYHYYLRFLNGDIILNASGGVTENTLRPPTPDGTDNKQTNIYGGGAGGSTRGAVLQLAGNEHSNIGDARLSSGGAAGAIYLQGYGSGGIHFRDGGTTRWQMTNAGDLLYTNTDAFIRANTSDGSDNKRLLLCGGGAQGDSRGATIYLYGNEHASAGSVEILAGGPNGQIHFETGNAIRWSITNTNGHLYQDVNNGGDLVFNRTSGTVRQGTSSGSDNKRLLLLGAGGTDTLRGGSIGLYGNNYTSSEGAVDIAAGTHTNSIISLNTNGTTKWQVTNAGDFVYTNTNTLIRANTADASDTKSIRITGGGASAGDSDLTRGGQCVLYGNESGVTGNAYLISGNVNSDSTAALFGNRVQLYQHGGSNVIHYRGNELYIDTTSSSFTMRMNTADGSDNKTIDICGGGGVSTTRGAIVSISGNDSGAVGNIQLNSGNVSGSCIYLTGSASNSEIRIFHNGSESWAFEDGRSLEYRGSTPGIIKTDTADGADTKAIVICGGGAGNNARGGTIIVEGNENSGGRITLNSGNLAASDILIQLGSTLSKFKVQSNNGSNNLWYFDGSNGDLFGDATNGGDIVFNRSGKDVISKVATGASGTGTTQGAGTAIVATRVEITTLTAGSAEAFVLPSTLQPGKTYTLFNRHASAAAKIFPASGHQIDSLGANNSYSIAAGQSVSLTAFSSTQWYSEASGAGSGSTAGNQVISIDDVQQVQNITSETYGNFNVLNLINTADGILEFTIPVHAQPTGDLTLKIIYAARGSGTGNFKLDLAYSILDVGDDASVNTFATTDTQTIALVAADQNDIKTATFTIPLANLSGGSAPYVISVQLKRDTAVGSNYASNVSLISLYASGLPSGGGYAGGDLNVSGSLIVNSDSTPLANAAKRRTFKTTTTDATTTTVISIPVTDNSLGRFSINIGAHFTSTSVDKNYWAKIEGAVRRRNAGTAGLVGTRIRTEDSEGSPGYVCDVAVSGNNLNITVTGAASETVVWVTTLDYQEAV